MWSETLNTTAATAIESELGPDERLLWFGGPRKGLRLQAADLFVIPFSLFWCGFALFWESMAIFSGGPFFMALFGIPFVLIGLYMVIGRFIVDAGLRERTFYGVT